MLFFACILSATWATKKTTGDKGTYYNLDLNNVHWGKLSDCNLTQYGAASASIAAFIMCWFFVLFRPAREAFPARSLAS